MGKRKKKKKEKYTERGEQNENLKMEATRKNNERSDKDV